jgi:hypothetical protein
MPRALHALLAASLATSVAACEPDTFVPQPGFAGPAGLITGSVTYVGPPPCTEGGRILGAVILLGFDVAALPPPDGLGTEPRGLSVITGETLFAGVAGQLSFAAGGSRLCPAGPTISATASYSLGPLTAAAYQIRGFYDRDADFQPTFSIFNLPTAGDVGGGALDNAAAAAAGSSPIFTAVEVGEPLGDGRFAMPNAGALVEGIPVTLGAVLPFERPVFHVQTVLDDAFGNSDPASVVIPADYQLSLFDATDPSTTEASFVRLVLGAGAAPEEGATSLESPFFFPEGASLFHARFDANADGQIDAGDSIPESPLIPALQPIALLSKLEQGSSLDAQQPAVLLQGVTLLDGLLQTATAPVDLGEARPSTLIALRPAVLCIDPARPDRPGVLVNTHATDAAGNTLIDDPAALEASLSAQFNRPVSVAIGCLPQGRYAMNLVYDSGQAWTVPNEAGVCGSDEPAGAGTCGTRPRLASQGVVVQIGAPGDPSYCQNNPTPPACAPVP